MTALAVVDRTPKVHLLFSFTLAASCASWLHQMFNVWILLLCRFVWAGCCVGLWKSLVSELFYHPFMFSFSASVCDAFSYLEMKKRRHVWHILWTWWNGQLEVSSTLLLMIWHWLIIVVFDSHSVITLMYIVTSFTLNLWQMFTLCNTSAAV